MNVSSGTVAPAGCVAPPVRLQRRRLTTADFFSRWCVVDAERYGGREANVPVVISALHIDGGVTLQVRDARGVELLYLSRAGAFELAEQLMLGRDPRRERR